jgi:hypothetical protein
VAAIVSSLGASVKCKHGSKSSIDRLHLNGVEPANELSEAMLWVDHRELLDDHAGFDVPDLDFRAKRGGAPAG